MGVFHITGRDGWDNRTGNTQIGTVIGLEMQAAASSFLWDDDKACALFMAKNVHWQIE